MSKTFDELFDDIDSALDYDAPEDAKELLRENLRAALDEALDDVASIDDLWSIFREHLTTALMERRLVQVPMREMRREILASLYATEKSVILAKAAEHVAANHRTEVFHAATRLFLEDQGNRREAELHARQLLVDELRPRIVEELKSELRKDEQVMREVKAELKRQIMGL
jgi:hypothetical protein